MEQADHLCTAIPVIFSVATLDRSRMRILHVDLMDCSTLMCLAKLQVLQIEPVGINDIDSWTLFVLPSVSYRARASDETRGFYGKKTTGGLFHVD